MIVTAGRMVRINDTFGRWSMSRSCEAPGRTVLTMKDGTVVGLPGNKDDAAEFIKAYQRIDYNSGEIE